MAVASASGMLITVMKMPSCAAIARDILTICIPIRFVFNSANPIFRKTGVRIIIPIPYLNKANSVGSNFRPSCLTMTSVTENKNAPILSHKMPRILPDILSQASVNRFDVRDFFKVVTRLLATPFYDALYSNA